MKCRFLFVGCAKTETIPVRNALVDFPTLKKGIDSMNTLIFYHCRTFPLDTFVIYLSQMHFCFLDKQ